MSLRAPQDGTTGFPDEIASFYGLQQRSVSVQNSGGHSWIMRTCGSDCAICVPYGIGRLRSEELWRNTEDDSAGFRGGGSRRNPGWCC